MQDTRKPPRPQNVLTFCSECKPMQHRSAAARRRNGSSCHAPRGVSRHTLKDISDTHAFMQICQGYAHASLLCVDMCGQPGSSTIDVILSAHFAYECHQLHMRLRRCGWRHGQSVFRRLRPLSSSSDRRWIVSPPTADVFDSSGSETQGHGGRWADCHGNFRALERFEVLVLLTSNCRD